jgi:hypothetical protein
MAGKLTMRKLAMTVTMYAMGALAVILFLWMGCFKKVGVRSGAWVC